MKKSISILLIIAPFIFLTCEKNNSYLNSNINACGVINPQKNIKWLKELIEKAEIDQTGNYKGTIWLEKYKGDDIFVTDMMMGSGAILYYYFDCEGESFVPENSLEFAYNIKKNIIVYSNIPFKY